MHSSLPPIASFKLRLKLCTDKSTTYYELVYGTLLHIPKSRNRLEVKGSNLTKFLHQPYYGSGRCIVMYQEELGKLKQHK